MTTAISWTVPTDEVCRLLDTLSPSMMRSLLIQFSGHEALFLNALETVGVITCGVPDCQRPDCPHLHPAS